MPCSTYGPNRGSPNRVDITNLVRSGVGQHRFSPAGDVFALIPTQVNQTVELFELPSGQPMSITTNGYASGQLTLTALSGQLSVANATAYGGITLTGISSGSASLTIDPPFRSRCATQVHLWIATPAGAASETGPGNIKLPASVNKQGASAYIARIGAGLSAQAIIVSQYVAPMMMNASRSPVRFAEAYSVADARPFQAKQRPTAAFQPLMWAQVGQRNLIIVGPNSPFFVVPYGLANDSAQPLDVRLELEQVGWSDLPPLRPLAGRRRVGTLEVSGAGFIDYPCGVLIGRDEVEATSDLRLELAPGERRVVGRPHRRHRRAGPGATRRCRLPRSRATVRRSRRRHHDRRRLQPRPDRERARRGGAECVPSRPRRRADVVRVRR